MCLFHFVGDGVLPKANGNGHASPKASNYRRLTFWTPRSTARMHDHNVLGLKGTIKMICVSSIVYCINLISLVLANQRCEEMQLSWCIWWTTRCVYVVCRLRVPPTQYPKKRPGRIGHDWTASATGVPFAGLPVLENLCTIHKMSEVPFTSPQNTLDNHEPFFVNLAL